MYATFAATGSPPSVADLAASMGEAAAGAGLQRLHDAHTLVLGGDGEIRMALPFSAVETGHRVTSGAMAWWANCAWDTLAIPVALDVDAEIRSTWMDTGAPVELAVSGGELSSTAGLIHFAIPAHRWWDDIVET